MAGGPRWSRRPGGSRWLGPGARAAVAGGWAPELARQLGDPGRRPAVAPVPEWLPVGRAPELARQLG